MAFFNNKLSISPPDASKNLDASKYVTLDGNDSTRKGDKLQLCYPRDIMDKSQFPAYTAFYINVTDEDTFARDTGTGSVKITDKTAIGATESSKLNASVIVSTLKSDSTKEIIPNVFGAKEAYTKLTNSITGLGASGRNNNRLESVIVLPTPSITSEYSQGWDGDDSMGDVIKATSVVNSIKEKNLGDAALKLAYLTADKKEGAFKTILDVGAKMTGRAVNPRKELFFTGVGFREFTFEYLLAPRNKAEAASIEAIINMFKYHARPGLAESGLFFTYPAQFDIVHYFVDRSGTTRVNPHMPRHVTSVLNKVSATYADEKYFLEGGYSPTIKLSLGFTEVGIITREDIVQGF